MISEVFTELATIITSFSTLLISLFGSVVTIFYNTTDGLTIVGVLTLVGVGTGLVIWAFKFIRSMITRIRVK